MGSAVPRHGRPHCPAPRSPAGDVAHHRDAELGFQVDAVGDAGGDDDLWGRLG